MGRHHEREAKLAVPPVFRLPQLAGISDGLNCTTAADLRFDSNYYDTPDLRLARSGVTLCHRSPDGWTLKIPDEGRGERVLSPQELTVTGEHGEVPSELVGLVTAWVRTSSLGAVASLRTLRRTSRLVDGHGDLVVEVVDDDVEVTDGLFPGLRFRELEVELAAGAPDAMASEVVALLVSAGACPADPVPKVFRALGHGVGTPPDLADGSQGDRPEPGSQGGCSAGDVILADLRASTTRLLGADIGVRLGDDPEALHQAQVAIRRLRSALRTWAPLLEAEWAAGLADELKRLGSSLGKARDADVLLDRLRQAAGELDEADTVLAARVLARLEHEAQVARVELAEALDDQRYRQLLERLVETVGDAGVVPAGELRPWMVGDAAEPAAEVVRRLVRRRWRQLRRAVRSLGSHPRADELHRVRIRAERCRYATEAAATAVGEPAEKLGRSLARLQETLGQHRDAVTAEAWLRSTVAALSPEEALVAGQLVCGQRAAAAAGARAWPKAWDKADRRKRRAWLKN